MRVKCSYMNLWMKINNSVCKPFGHVQMQVLGNVLSELD